MGLFRKKLYVPVLRMIDLESQIAEQNIMYEQCTGDKITDFSEFDYEKFINFFGFRIEIEDLSCYFGGDINYMTMKDKTGIPVIKVDNLLADKLKEDKINWNDFLVRRFYEVSIDHGKEFDKYPNGSIFIRGKIDVNKVKTLRK